MLLQFPPECDKYINVDMKWSTENNEFCTRVKNRLGLTTASGRPLFSSLLGINCSDDTTDVTMTHTWWNYLRQLTCSICLYQTISTSSSWRTVSELPAATVTSSKACSLEKSTLSIFFNFTVPSMLIRAPERARNVEKRYLLSVCKCHCVVSSCNY